MLIVDEQAQTDLREAYHWYEDREIGLGDQFFDAFDDACRRIDASPRMYGIVCEDVRCKLMRRFPYVIYYRIEADRVVVLAVVHGHRDPQVWQSRI